MLKILKKLYNTIFMFHKIITRKTCFGLTNTGIIYFLLMVIIAIINNLII